MRSTQTFTEWYILKRASYPSQVESSSEEALDLAVSFQQELTNRFPHSLLPFMRIKPIYLVSALTHRSFLHEWPNQPFSHQERWEFLGDSILGVLASEELFHRFPVAEEGTLSILRSRLVCGECLTKLALFLQLDDMLLLGRGEEQALTKKSQKGFVSDTFEAILGAFFSSVGLEETRAWYGQLLETWQKREHFSLWEKIQAESFDAKSSLQQETLAYYKKLPVYQSCRFLDQHGAETFGVSIMIQEKHILSGRGPSKKQLEKLLASLILEHQLYLPSYLGALRC